MPRKIEELKISHGAVERELFFPVSDLPPNTNTSVTPGSNLGDGNFQ
jgi:hypothetical protein